MLTYRYRLGRCSAPFPRPLRWCFVSSAALVLVLRSSSSRCWTCKRIIRNAHQQFNWHHLHLVLFSAAGHAVDLGLLEAQRVLERTIWRGLCVMRRFQNDAALTLALFTDKLPNSRGVSKLQLDLDSKQVRALQKAMGKGGGSAAHSGGKSARSGYGVGGGVGLPSLLPAAAGFSPPLSMGLGSASGLAPTMPSPFLTSPLAGGALAGAPSAGGGLGAAAVTLPLPGGSSGGGGTAKRKPSKGGAKGGNRSQPRQPPSNRSVSAVAAFNNAIQEAQEQFVQVAGGPTCDKCTAQGRNPYHNHLACAYATCSKCRRGGHRANACPFH